MKLLLNTFKTLAIGSVAVLAGCSSTDGGDAPAEGEGCVSLMASFPDRSSAGETSTGSDLLETCTIYLSNSQGHIRTYNGIDELPDKLWLPSGSYVAEAWAGDSVPASFESKYFRGYQPFTVTKGETSSVSLRCPLANVVVSVTFDESVAEALSTCELTVSHPRGRLTFGRDETRKGYFMLPNGVTDLNWTLNGEGYDGAQFSKQGVLRNVSRATEYRLKFTYTGVPSVQGGAAIGLTLDLSEVDIYDDVELKSAPVIALDGLDIDQQLTYERGNSRRHAVTVAAPAGLASVELSSEQFPDLGLDETSFGLFNPSEATISALYSKGINIATRHNDDGSDEMVVNFSAKLCNLLPAGDYEFQIKATDKESRISVKSLKIKIVAPAQNS